MKTEYFPNRYKVDGRFPPYHCSHARFNSKLAAIVVLCFDFYITFHGLYKPSWLSKVQNLDHLDFLDILNPFDLLGPPFFARLIAEEGVECQYVRCATKFGPSAENHLLLMTRSYQILKAQLMIYFMPTNIFCSHKYNPVWIIQQVGSADALRCRLLHQNINFILPAH